MKVIDIPLEQLKEAPWNPNKMEEDILARLRESIRRYGVVENLVVRSCGTDTYEVLSGNQRLGALREMAVSHAPCVVVELDDAHARLLAEALNHLRGQDDLGLRAELLRKVLESTSLTDVLAVLPETAGSLKALSSMGQADLATYLQNWQQAQGARLKHLQFQLVPEQLDVVEEALQVVMPRAKDSKTDNPNTRGKALYLLCKDYLEREKTQ